MNTNEKSDLPPEVLAAFAKAEQADQVRNQVTVGALLGSISHEHLGDRQASPDELLRVADVGKTLLYAALGHRDATPAVLEEAREFWGPPGRRRIAGMWNSRPALIHRSRGRGPGALPSAGPLSGPWDTCGPLGPSGEEAGKHETRSDAGQSGLLSVGLTGFEPATT